VTSRDTHSNGAPNSRRWAILAVLGIAQLMVVLDATIVNIALPSAQEALGFSDSDRQWVVTAYALAFGSLLLLGGRIGDLFGRRRTFVVGLVGFAIVSAIGGAATSFELLVGARALQGAFAALLAPAALSLLTTTFPSGPDRGKAFGIFGAIAGTGGAIGLLLGGLLTEYLSWRWAMYVNLAFALPAVLGALAVIHDTPRTTRPHIDVPGVLTASGGVFSLVYGFAHAESSSWTDPVTLGFLTAGVALLAAFVLIERRVANPLLPLRVVTDRDRAGSYVAFGLAGAGMFGVFLFLTYYLQQTLGYSPIRTGVAFLPMVAAIMVTASSSTARLAPRLGPRPLVPVGMLFAAGALLFMTRLGLDSTYAADVLPALLLLGVGMGLIFAPSMSTATAGVPAKDAGVASAMVNTSQQVGGSLGTALLNTLFAAAVADYLAGHGTGRAATAAAAMQGYSTAFAWAAGIFAVGAVLTALLFRSGAPASATASAPVGEPALAH
jgi:EmrB/QacA subfamily drug resistance transporter